MGRPVFSDGVFDCRQETDSHSYKQNIIFWKATGNSQMHWGQRKEAGSRVALETGKQEWSQAGTNGWSISQWNGCISPASSGLGSLV